VGLRVLITWSN